MSQENKSSETIARNKREHDRIWNTAIEAAAKLAETSKGYPTTVSQNILKLKK